MELGKAIEFAQAVWPIAKVVVPALFALGWVSPAFPTRKRKDGRGRIDNEVVEKSTSLFGKINAAKDLGHKPKLSDKINLTISFLSFLFSLIAFFIMSKKSELGIREKL